MEKPKKVAEKKTEPIIFDSKTEKHKKSNEKQEAVVVEQKSEKLSLSKQFKMNL
jgi:hypothetical protein